MNQNTVTHAIKSCDLLTQNFKDMKNTIVYVLWSGTNDGLLTDKTIYRNLIDAVHAFRFALAYAEDEESRNAFLAVNDLERIRVNIDHVNEFDAQTLISYYGKFNTGVDFMHLEALPLK